MPQDATEPPGAPSARPLVYLRQTPPLRSPPPTPPAQDPPHPAPSRQRVEAHTGGRALQQSDTVAAAAVPPVLPSIACTSTISWRGQKAGDAPSAARRRKLQRSPRNPSPSRFCRNSCRGLPCVIRRRLALARVAPWLEDGRGLSLGWRKKDGTPQPPHSTPCPRPSSTEVLRLSGEGRITRLGDHRGSCPERADKMGSQQS